MADQLEHLAAHAARLARAIDLGLAIGLALLAVTVPLIRWAMREQRRADLEEGLLP